MLSVYYFLTQGVVQIIALPVWWYSSGLGLMLDRLLTREAIELKQINVWAWFKNLLVPMFHDYTVIGRGISLVMRLIVILLKLGQLVLGLSVRLLLLGVYLILPLVFIWGLINLIA